MEIAGNFVIFVYSKEHSRDRFSNTTEALDTQSKENRDVVPIDWWCPWAPYTHETFRHVTYETFLVCDQDLGGAGIVIKAA